MLSDLDGPKKLNLTLSAKLPQPTMAMVKFPAPPVEVMVKYLGFDQGGGGDVEGSNWWAIYLRTVSYSILLLDIEADVDVMSGWLLKDCM